jgi:hypothetical protein
MRRVTTPFSHCGFGLARTDITPPVGIYHRMWGAARHERAAGIHRPLTATAMVFRPLEARHDAAVEQVLIAIDHCLLWSPDMEELLRATSEHSGVPAEQLIVTFSHSHAAGRIDTTRRDRPGGELVGPYLEDLASKLAGIINEARQTLKPAILTYATGRCTLATHRDFWDEESRQYVCGFNPEGPADDTVLVARVSAEDGSPRAVIVNYGCHPTTLAWENTLISPDFPGAMREVIEQATGVPCVFLQGASGDIGPREGYVADVEVADRNGRQLGYASLAALESMPPPATDFIYQGPVVSGATLGTWQHLPLQPDALRARSAWRCRRWTVDLPYRADLPDLRGTEAERSRWLADEAAALKRGDQQTAQDCRAMIERMDRQLTRLSSLPPGPSFPMPVTLWQVGDAIWVAVECEHYNLLQRALRHRFPGVPIIVITLANGSRATYLPSADAYGKGIYQETIAVVAPGSLERLIEAITQEIETCLKEHAHGL